MMAMMSPFAKGDNDYNNDEYGKDGNIPDDDDEYPVGIGGVDKPLDEGNNECGILSAAPTRACPENQWPSMPSR
jgi:hypothetical protein